MSTINTTILAPPCQTHALPETLTVITLLRSDRPAQDKDLAWLLVPDNSRDPPRETIDKILGRLAPATGATG